ncbi:MAG: oxygen-independent coproporphyrinogen III oxidase [Flavobacterium sp.]|uniref:oxygen-independent coproporphyrinogen III oxidase n=1 Tax=Flavobacterium sp. TaxID=239 RepID=UPI001200EA95|nr:oxygen-independent coproporphyrinogen III oxidase [Flavobacterium sp.]RZJ68680.1 MAG: oxygen-independent coproporphyrinogen III oxidase [Flavobacterium sp.]
MNTSLFSKYNVPGPRYTSYPTVPYWDESFFGVESWKDNLCRSFLETNAIEGISLYIHLPFCESMCTFCGCFKRITKNHSVETTYIKAILKEWKLYCRLLGERPRIAELHLGGGTPTFFSSQNLEDLINGIFSSAERTQNCEMSFEGHPNNTTRQHLEKLYELGFRRVSFGVQDYCEIVQQAINRVQPFQNVAKVTLWAREIGYTSVGHDLVYGLPFQTKEAIIDTIEKTYSLHPDRISFYSYAHVPWLKGNGQRGFRDEDIPKDAQKRDLYETGKNMLSQHGYYEIGMDHFALATDSLFKAAKNGSLHRNFMGYNASKTQLMIGLGVSSISDSWYSFAQNVKNLEDYYQMLEWDALPVVKGHTLTAEDLTIRKHILNLTCFLETSWEDRDMQFKTLANVMEKLIELQNDGLVTIKGNVIKITETGRPFLRNVCMAFDLRMTRTEPERNVFSTTI